MKRTLLYIIISLSFCKAWAGWNGTSDFITHGSGTQDDPYLIETSEQLAYVADMVNSGANNFEGQFLRLTTDLSLSNRQWTPIGDKNHPFMGNFYGNGHIIDSLYTWIYFDVTPAPQNYLGLFGHTNDALINNVVIYAKVGQEYGGSSTGSYSSPAGTSIVGGLVGLARNTTIQLCKVYGTILSEVYNASINNNNAKEFGTGGIVGIVRNSILQQNENYAVVRGAFASGGIVGRADTSIIYQCANMGDITTSTHNSVVCGYAYAGGIAGIGTPLSVIKKSKNIGQIHGENFLTNNTPCFVSGISKGVSEISFCYNIGTISVSYCGNGGSVNKNKGTIYGIGQATMIKCCYNVGVVGPSEYRNKYPIGYTFQDSTNYYLESCLNGSTTTPEFDHSAGSPRSEAQMKSAVFPQMLNIGEVVYRQDTYNENGGYPVFIDENSGVFHISVTSEDESKGSVRVLSEPTADNPEAIVVAIPRGSYHFSHWSDGSTNNPYTLTLSQDTTLVAYFANENEAIFSIEGIDAKIYSNWGQVVVDGLNGNKVSLYDESGRLLVSQGDGLHTFCYDVPFSGIYFIRVGNAPARKLVVIK